MRLHLSTLGDQCKKKKRAQGKGGGGQIRLTPRQDSCETRCMLIRAVKQHLAHYQQRVVGMVGMVHAMPDLKIQGKK